MKKAQAGKKVVKKPTYKNLRMGVAAASKTEGRDYTEKATKQDSINYVRGFNRGLRKDKETRNDLDEVEKMGRWEGLNTKKSGGPVKKAQTGAKVGGPTYSNLKVKNPTAKDSLRYKSAYDKVMNNQRLNFPSRVEAEGSQEALKKLKDMKSKGVDKSKSGSRIKKAANGTSLGMKSVKAGFDKNPGVTRADIITAAKGKAKSGAKMKNGGTKKAALGALLPLAMKAAPMVAGMLGGGGKGKSGGMGGMLGGLLGGKNGKNVKKAKSGGSMKKCRYGCK